MTLQPEGVLTGWLPVLSPWIGSGWGMCCPPVPGDQVLVIAQEGEAEHGLIIGRAFSSTQTPPTVPVPLIGDAATDPQSRQGGMTAGMRAVLEVVLERLDPEKLATLQSRRSIFDFLWPARRRARLWDTYLSQYRSLREEAKDNGWYLRILGQQRKT